MRRSMVVNAARNAILFVAVGSAVLVPCFALAAGTADVTVAAPSGTVEPGAQFTVDIQVQPNNAVAGMQFNLSFDSDLVTVDSVTEGNLLNQNGAGTYFNAGSIDNEAGTITNVFGAIISPGQTVSTAGVFATITMTASETGGSSPLTLSNVIIGDAGGQSVAVNVHNDTVTVNLPPVLAAIGDRSADEGQALTFSVSASDPNGDTLIYSAQNLPAGASFNPSTRVFTWSPSYSQAGTYSGIQFTVSDGSLTDSENIDIVVANVYQPDVTGDGHVNVLDIISIAQHWEESGANGWIVQDINENGTINVLDIIMVGQYWTA